MRDGENLVFVEVRQRRKNKFYDAAVSVGPSKQAKLTKAAGIFLSWNPKLSDATVRFDVVALDATSEGTSVRWICDAFRPQ